MDSVEADSGRRNTFLWLCELTGLLWDWAGRPSWKNFQIPNPREGEEIQRCLFVPSLPCIFPSVFYLASVYFSFLSFFSDSHWSLVLFDEECSFSRPFVCSMRPWIHLASRYFKHSRAGWQFHLRVFVIWKCSIAFFIWFSFWMEKQGAESAALTRSLSHTAPNR